MWGTPAAGTWREAVETRIISTWYLTAIHLVDWLCGECCQEAGAAGASVLRKLGPYAPGDALYRFDAPELKAASHRPRIQALPLQAAGGLDRRASGFS